MVVVLLSSFSVWVYKARLLPPEFNIQRLIEFAMFFKPHIRLNRSDIIPRKSVIQGTV